MHRSKASIPLSWNCKYAISLAQLQSRIHFHIFCFCSFSHSRVHGPMLFTFICQLESYCEAIVLHYMAQLTDALNWLHQRNVAHLDIKPENILVSPTSKLDVITYRYSSAAVLSLQNPHLKLIDFGDAFSAINRNTIAPSSNLEFSAPEVVIGHTALGTATGKYSILELISFIQKIDSFKSICRLLVLWRVIVCILERRFAIFGRFG